MDAKGRKMDDWMECEWMFGGRECDQQSNQSIKRETRDASRHWLRLDAHLELKKQMSLSCKEYLKVQERGESTVSLGTLGTKSKRREIWE
jgi:hypothetical protein